MAKVSNNQSTNSERQKICAGDTLPDLAPAAIAEETSKQKMSGAQASLEVVLRDISERSNATINDQSVDALSTQLQSIVQGAMSKQSISKITCYKKVQELSVSHLSALSEKTPFRIMNVDKLNVDFSLFADFLTYSVLFIWLFANR